MGPSAFSAGGRFAQMMSRGVAVAAVLVGAAAGVLAAINGDLVFIAAMALTALSNALHLVVNSAARPGNVTRSLEASRRILVEGN